MPRVKNTFTGGKMNKDLDSRLVPIGEYRDALNIKVSTSASGDVGSIETVLSNEALTALSFGAPVTVGAYVDKFANNIYWWVLDAGDSYLLEWDIDGEALSIVLQDTRVGASQVLGLDGDFLITGAAIVVDSDSGDRYLIWTDNLNPIRFINIDTAKTYGVNGFSDADISVAKAPPLNAPTITLGNTASGDEDTLSDRFLRFAYRYHYVDGQVSPLSPFSETAFLPETFQFDYALASNESMNNQYNQVTIGFNTGIDIVKKVEVVFKDSGSTTVQSIKTFDKTEEGWADSSSQSTIFTNNSSYTPLPEDQLFRLFDNVPLRAKALELIGNRLVIGNYVEGYNIVDDLGAPIKIDFTVDVVRSAITPGTPTQSMKSNRSYEIGIVYLDDYGRQSTVLVSEANTVIVPNDACDEKNVIQVTITNLAPDWATKYRLFIKQVKEDYDVIVPAIFYQDGVYTWVRLEADDQNKVSVGDYIYVKSDASQVLETAAQTRVLEIKNQDANFLENTVPDPYEELQIAGTYIRIKPTDFNMNPDSVAVYENVTEGFRTDNTTNNFNSNQAYIEPAIYYGTDGLNDLTRSGTYTGTDDIRYEIDIFTVGSTDTYRWRKITTSDGVVGAWDDNTGAGYNITGAAQTLDNGVQITFGATTGHSSDDSWIVSAKSTARITATNGGGSPGSLGRRALMHYKAKATSDTNGEGVLAGAVITITYDDSRSNSSNVSNIFGRSVDTFISSSAYANIEEWFFGENIISQLTPTLVIGDVLFRRGSLSANTQNVTINPSGDMIMTFSSIANYTGASNNEVRTDSILEIRELDNNIIFETIPPQNNSAFFYEVSQTYDINSSRHHQGNGGIDQNQTGIQDAIVHLPTFNCFSWGNAFESYKWKDGFNQASMKIDSRPSDVVPNYKQNIRIADLTYSATYEQSTNYNGLSEFNLHNVNFFTDIDDKYGSIQKLYAEDTNLLVFSEDKVHNVPFEKDILFDADGNGTLRESTNVLGTPRGYAGEYGISTFPESLTVYGTRKYFADPKRGVWLRLSTDGITEISEYGMRNYFRDVFRQLPSNTRLYSCYDLREKELVMSIVNGDDDDTLAFSESVKGFTSFYSFVPEFMVSIDNEFYSFRNGNLYRHHDTVSATRATFYGVAYDATLKFFFNQAPSVIKVGKAVTLEGNKAWDLSIKSYLNDETVSITQTDRAVADFLNREGQWDVFLEGSTLSGDLTGHNAYGLGTVSGVSTSTITLNNTFGSKIAEGDTLYEEDGTTIGVVQSYDPAANTIVVDTTPTIAGGTFIYGLKPARYDGSAIRGYNFEVDLTDTTNTRTELFAANLEIFQSLPSQ